jgi:hypothetical protein
MKKLIYKAAALLMLLTEDPDIWLDAPHVNPYKDDMPYSYFDLGDILDFLIEYYIEDWWELITSVEQDPSPTPWFLNERDPYLAAKRDLDYPINTMSPKS